MTDMIRVSSTGFGKEVGGFQDMALAVPVVVTPNGRDRQVFAAGELPDDMIDAIRNAEVDERHQHLDSLIPDWSP